MNKFKAGQKYKVLKPMTEAGNVIEITKVKDKEIYYKTLYGETPIFNWFNINSSMAKTLKKLSEPEESEESETIRFTDEEKEKIIKILMSIGLTHEDLVKIELFVLLGGIEDGK